MSLFCNAVPVSILTGFLGAGKIDACSTGS